MRICILGAGIVGLATAWELSRAGHRVCLIDRLQPGQGTSSGNGGQLSYAYVAPLAEPGIWAQLPQLLLASDSPLKLRLSLDVQQWLWGLRFLAACRAGSAARTTAQLLALAAHSRSAFEQMRAQLNPDCDFAANGKLVLYRSPASLHQAEQQLGLQAQLGGPLQKLVSAEDCVAIEPALHGQQQHLAGGIHTPSECVVDSLKLCHALAQALQDAGVPIHGGCEVQSLEQRQGRIVAVHTGTERFEADAFVVALGSHSTGLARQLGVRLPVYPLKGYSITLAPPPNARTPKVSITDAARKTVFAPLGQRLRVAGMAELVGHDMAIPPARVRTLLDNTQALFPQCLDGDDSPAPNQAWAGLRPATPTGLPVVGRRHGAPENLWFNTGHGALGLTLAFGTARQLVEQMPQP